MGIKHSKTACYHPQTNTYAEVFNKEIQKYMRAILDNNQTLDWEQYLAPLELSYNTMISKSVMHSPFFLTFLQEPRMPFFNPEKEKTLYSDDYATGCLSRLRVTYRLAAATQEENNRASLAQRNKGAQHVEFLPEQPVLVAFPIRELEGNAKLRKPYSEGYAIQERIGEYTYVVRNVKTGRRHTVHADLLRAAPEMTDTPAVAATAAQAQQPGESRRKSKHPCNQTTREGVRAECHPADAYDSHSEPINWLPARTRPVSIFLEQEEEEEWLSANEDEEPVNTTASNVQQNTPDTPVAGPAPTGPTKPPDGPSGPRTRSKGKAEDQPLVPRQPPEYKRRAKGHKKST